MKAFDLLAPEDALEAADFVAAGSIAPTLLRAGRTDEYVTWHAKLASALAAELLIPAPRARACLDRDGSAFEEHLRADLVARHSERWIRSLEDNRAALWQLGSLWEGCIEGNPLLAEADDFEAVEHLARGAFDSMRRAIDANAIALVHFDRFLMRLLGLNETEVAKRVTLGELTTKHGLDTLIADL